MISDTNELTIFPGHLPITTPTASVDQPFPLLMKSLNSEMSPMVVVFWSG